MGWFTGFIKLSYTFHIQWHKKFKLFVKCLPLLQASLLTALIQAGLSFTVIDQDKTGSCMTCVLSSEHQRAYWSWLDWTGTSTQCHCLSSKQVINTLPVPLPCNCQSWFGDSRTGSGTTHFNLKEGQTGLASDLLDYRSTTGKGQTGTTGHAGDYSGHNRLVTLTSQWDLWLQAVSRNHRHLPGLSLY